MAQTLRVLADQQVRTEINLGIELLERTISEVNVELLKKKDEDVWLYFYEHFLAAYDPQLRKDRGAYYTPVQVIRCQCELVEDLLQERFKKELGFGDKKVVVLDPGAGTGAYPLAAMQKGFRAVEKKYGAGAVGGYASRMAVNINAFEILVWTLRRCPSPSYATGSKRWWDASERWNPCLFDRHLGIAIFGAERSGAPLSEAPR